MGRSTKPAAEAVTEPVDPFAHVRTDLIEAIGGTCDSCGNFKNKELNFSALGREIGVSNVILGDYLRGRADVGRKTLSAIINYLNSRKATPEQAEALAEVESLS